MSRRVALAICGAVLLLALAVPPFVASNSYVIHILVMCCYFAYLGSCWNLLGGYAGQPSLGHAAFIGIGAYTSTVLFRDFGITPWLGMWAGGLLAALFGLLAGYATFHYRVRDIYFLLVTLAFAEILRIVMINIQHVGGASGISVTLKNDPLAFQFSEKLPYYYIGLAMLLAVIGVSYLFSRSKVGFYCVAIRENEDAAQALGVPVVRYKLIATALSAFLSALGGTFFAQYVTFIDPFSIMGMSLSVEVLIYPIIGGVGTVLGPTIGALILVPLAEGTRSLTGTGQTGVSLMVYSAFMVIAILFMPEGILGILRSRGLLRDAEAAEPDEPPGVESRPVVLGPSAGREGL